MAGARRTTGNAELPSDAGLPSAVGLISPPVDSVFGLLGTPGEPDFFLCMHGLEYLIGHEATSYLLEVRRSLDDWNFRNLINQWQQNGLLFTLPKDLWREALQKYSIKPTIEILEDHDYIPEFTSKSEQLHEQIAALQIAALIDDASISVELWDAISDNVRARLESRSEKGPDRTYASDTLRAIGIVSRSISDRSDRLDRLVQRAREHGSTWEQIASAAGVSRQTAHQRWTEKGKAAHRKRQQRHIADPQE